MVPNPQGQLVPGLRVRVPRQHVPPQRAQIAHNAAARAQQPTPPVAAYDDGLDDEIPF